MQMDAERFVHYLLYQIGHVDVLKACFVLLITY